MIFCVIELKTRAVHVAGIRVNPDSRGLMQVTRRLLDPDAGFPRDARYLVHDRDPLYIPRPGRNW
jgi:hypothetical protein